MTTLRSRWSAPTSPDLGAPPTSRPTGPVALGTTPRPPGAPLRVHVTVDVECSMGGVFGTRYSTVLPVGPNRRIYGRIGGQEYGIRRIMNSLERYGLRGTFFLEPLCSAYFGEGRIGDVAREIRGRGHDPELHLHPNQQAFRTLRGEALVRATRNPYPDKMWHYSVAEQTALIEEGAGLIERWTGRRPVAFRAGGYAANRGTIRAVRNAGLLIDSSRIHPRVGSLCRLPGAASNSPGVTEGVVLLPLTCFVHRRLPGRVTRKCLEIPAVTVEQIRRALGHLAAAGTTDAVLILHSFSLLKSRDVQYRRIRPDYHVMRRLDAVLDHLASRPDLYRVSTMCELAAEIKEGRVRFGGPGELPEPGFVPGLIRDLAQLANRW